MAPATEPDPGSPEYQAADAEVRRLDAQAWEDLGFLGQVGVAFERFDREGKQRGATFNADSAARRLQTVLDLQRRQDASEELNVTEKKYLLRNHTVASELAGAVGRLTEARQHLDSLPASDRCAGCSRPRRWPRQAGCCASIPARSPGRSASRACRR